MEEKSPDLAEEMSTSCLEAGVDSYNTYNLNQPQQEILEFPLDNEKYKEILQPDLLSTNTDEAESVTQEKQLISGVDSDMTACVSNYYNFFFLNLNLNDLIVTFYCSLLF